MWYVSSRLFEGTDLGVNYARIYNANQAMLYNAKIDLRFDLEAQTTTDRYGNSYNGYAIERGGVIFFPLPLVCSRFGLRWSNAVAPGHQGPDQIRLLHLLGREQEGGLPVPQTVQKFQCLLRGLTVDDEINLLSLRRQ